MGKVKVSVIIPVYNVQDYLEETLNSILNQSLREIEILAINDGSTDKSFEILEIYRKKDRRIKIISQENQGQSIARNKGIDLSKGEYIYFMDSDDLIELNLLEDCYKLSILNKLDFLFFDALSFSENFEKEKLKDYVYDREGLVEEVMSGKKYLEKLIIKENFKCPPWLYFINSNFLKKNRLRFYPKIIHEDELFSYQLYLRANRVKYLNKKLFKRRVRLNSTMTSNKGEKNIIGYLTVVQELNKMRSGDNESSNLLKYQIKRILNAAVGVYNYLESDLKIKYREQLEYELKKCSSLKSRISFKYSTLFKVLKKLKSSWR